MASPTFWLDIVGMSALAAGVGIALDDFDNEGIYAGFAVLSVLLIAGGVAMHRLTWTLVGLGALAFYVIHLLADVLGTGGSYVLTLAGLAIVAAALYYHARVERRRPPSNPPVESESSRPL